jgi:hypothetical protein
MTVMFKRKERRKAENELQRREYNTMQPEDVEVKRWVSLGTEALGDGGSVSLESNGHIPGNGDGAKPTNARGMGLSATKPRPRVAWHC